MSEIELSDGTRFDPQLAHFWSRDGDEKLYLTADRRWVIQRFCVPSSCASCKEITEEEAAQWLSTRRNSNSVKREKTWLDGDWFFNLLERNARRTP